MLPIYFKNIVFHCTSPKFISSPLKFTLSMKHFILLHLTICMEFHPWMKIRDKCRVEKKKTEDPTQTHCITRIQAFLSKPYDIKESTVRMLFSLDVRQNVRKETSSYQWCHKKKYPKAQLWHIKVRINITLLNSPSKFIKAYCYTLWKICFGSIEPGFLQIAGKPPYKFQLCRPGLPAIETLL